MANITHTMSVKPLRGLVRMAIAFVAVHAFSATSVAAPIVGVLNNSQGQFWITGGLTGEVFVALRGPADLLIPSGALPSGSLTLDATLPGEIAYLGLGGIQGGVLFGNVVKPNANYAELTQLRMAYQVSFTSELIEVPITFTHGHNPWPPNGDPNGAYFIYGGFDPPDGFPFPEPGAGLLATLAFGAVAVHRRRSPREMEPGA